MEQIDLRAEPRTLTGRHVKRLRTQGYVPAILYGSHIQATPIQIDGKTLERTLARASGKLISLQIGGDMPVLTLAREVQRDSIRHHVLHVDFYQVVMTEKITAQVPLLLTGEAPAVAEHGGILVHGLNTVEVECLPGDLPPAIEVDLSPLTEFNAMVTVADLQVPPAVIILSDAGSVIARIEQPRMVEEVAEEVEAPAEPELVGRRPEQEEEEKD